MTMDLKTDAVIFFDQGRLACVGQDLTRIPPVLARLHGENVECLDLSGNMLVTLQGIEEFSNLKELIIDGNLISENVAIPFTPNLTTLSINKNKIKNLELFMGKVAKNFPNLKYISLLGNAACPDQLSDVSNDDEDYARYRCFVVHHLPRLTFLDSAPVLAKEVIEARRRGHLLRVAKPTTVQNANDFAPCLADDLTPLPRTRRDIGEHQGAYGKCRYRYSGKHSEGNRFIQNNDL